MKYKVGDKVRVRSDLELHRDYYMSDLSGAACVIRSMIALRGKVVVIEGRDGVFYRITGSVYNWTDTMFSGKAERKFNGLLEQEEGKIDDI